MVGGVLQLSVLQHSFPNCEAVAHMYDALPTASLVRQQSCVAAQTLVAPDIGVPRPLFPSKQQMAEAVTAKVVKRRLLRF